MSQSLVSIPVALLALSALIFIHELAHFLVGKAVGIHAETFSIGFGPPLVRWRWGSTEYRVSWIPAGGYVKFPGEYEEGDERLSGEYYAAPVWKRMLVVAAGPVSNLIVGIVVFAGLAAYGLPEPVRPVIGEIIQPSPTPATYYDDASFISPAARAGILPHDIVQKVDGRPVRTWDEFTQEVMIRPEKRITLELIRDGRSTEIDVTPRAVLRGKMTIGQIGVAPLQNVVIVDGEQRLPVEKVDGAPFYGWNQFRQANLAEDATGPAGDAVGASEAAPAEGKTVLTLGGDPRDVIVRSRPIVAHVDASEAPGELEGVDPGDAIVAVNGEPTPGFQRLRAALLIAPTEPVALTVADTEGKQRTVTVTPRFDVTVAGVDATANESLRPLRARDRARLVAVNGVRLDLYERVRQELAKAAAAGAPVTLTFERERRVLLWRRSGSSTLDTPVHADGDRFVIPGLALQTNYSSSDGALDLGAITLTEQLELLDARTEAKIEVEYATPGLVRYAPVDAVGQGFVKTVDTTRQMLSLLKRLVVGEVSVRYISGPVGIVNITQRTIERGGWSWDTLLSLFYLMGFISVNLAIVNLLPIPIVDGGQLMFFSLEGIRGRPLDLKWQVAIQQVSLVLLIGLFALVTLKDLVYW
ncbi:hypothetical protein FJZ36_06385 [Candidatus Poribacteria bacterium]|nr:hypothetical protein [Candidatus Poribacteria bacterium]